MPPIRWVQKTVEFALSTSSNKAQPIWHGLERRVLATLAGWPDRYVHLVLVVLFSAWVIVDVLFLGVTGGLAQSTYDGMVRGRLMAAPHDPRIVIVDIDEAALARMAPEFGRWPWPRDTLATVLDYVESQQPQAVVWDIVFSDVDRLSPGGDAAFDEAAKRSAHSHFSVVRLPKANDDKSQVTQKNLPTLWIQQGSAAQDAASAVAMIPPVLPGVAAKPLGYNNGYVDRDGVLRRYRYFERLDDGGILQSLPMSVVQGVDPSTHAFWLTRFQNDNAKADTEHATAQDVLVNWRGKPNNYPRVNFADVFAAADGGKPMAELPSFAGKIVIIGATAPSLHDIHPTPLSATQAGVESLATGIDNALHRRVMRELPKWAGALLAILMCAGIALWSYRRSVSSLAPAMVALPGILLGVSFISLHTEAAFLDLHLSAALAVLFLAVLRVWYSLRKRHWCGELPAEAGPLAVWSWEASKPWTDDLLDRLMTGLQKSAAHSRLVLLDISPADSNLLKWRPFATCLAIVGPATELEHAQQALLQAVHPLRVRTCALQHVPALDAPSDLQRRISYLALQGWGELQHADSSSNQETTP